MPPIVEIKVVTVRRAHQVGHPFFVDRHSLIPSTPQKSASRKSPSPPRADSLVSMLRSVTVDDDYFERRALRATCIQRTPLEDFHPQASEIIPGLFVCDMYTATSPAVRRGLGITHIASVVKRDCPRFPLGMQHICIPIEDSRQAELLGYLDFTVEWISGALRQNGQVMIHCIWGMSRSASVAIAYLMVAKHMPLEVALKFVVSKRQVVKPNSGFMRQLKVYERILKTREQRIKEERRGEEIVRALDSLNMYDN